MFFSCSYKSIFLIETYAIEDCHYYNSNTYSSSDVTLNVTLPSHFSLEYELVQVSRNNSVPYLDIGASSNSRLLVGQYAKAGSNGIIAYKPSSTTFAHSNSTGLSPTVNKIKFTYTGEDYTYSLNDVDMTVANQNISLDKIIHIAGGAVSNHTLSKIKVKQL